MTRLKRFTISLLIVLPLAFTAVSAKAKDIVDTAVSAGQFGTLVAAVQAAGLVDVLHCCDFSCFSSNVGGHDFS